MGPRLRAYVEQQLLDDLRHYGIDPGVYKIDWADACQEGHCTSYMDGNLEELSGINVLGPDGEVVADGWMDFIHGGGNHPLFVFWLFLAIGCGTSRHEVKRDVGIPVHVWERLPDSTKTLCARADEYDARWASDPLVVEWVREHAG
jgi:hypothetical protein